MQLSAQQVFERALALHRDGKLADAENLYRQILHRQPDHAGALHFMGVMHHQRGQNQVALDFMQRSIQLAPNISAAHCNLGLVFQALGRRDEALAGYQRSISLGPQNPEAYCNIGSLLTDMGRLDEALTACQTALGQRPNYSKAYACLGNVLKDMGRIDEAVEAYRKAHAAEPASASTHSSLVYALHFHPAYDPPAIAAEHRLWNQQHALPLLPTNLSYPNSRDPHRRLRVGYVSPNFREHVIGQNMMPLFANHDRSAFEITCYSQVARPDSSTAEFKRHSDHWREIHGMDDAQLAQQIRDDQIDILVDLTMHLADSRLLAFARKPAPVQITFAAYPGSTGLSAIDYRLSDPYLDPPGMDESIYTERTVRLPDSFWCYDPLSRRDIAVGPLPAVKNGMITFGCLNNFAKVNQQVTALWARVLQKIPGCQMMIICWAGSARDRVLNVFRANDVDPGRIIFTSRLPRRDYLETYNQIDIGLDTFPYNGHTTSLDSFWMGVPVVTLVGNTIVSRAGWCQLSNLGLTELAANDADQFVQIASSLAADVARLETLRAGLRHRMERSPLMDGVRFARHIEAAYRQMWNDWWSRQA